MTKNKIDWKAAYEQKFEAVPGSWLVKALAGTLLGMALCLYLIYAALFTVGQWQLVLQPTHEVKRTPADAGLQFEAEQFGVDANGQPQRTGWWVPAEPGARYGSFTVLYLHGGAGELQDALPTIAMLHAMGVNVFAPEYGGYGAKRSPHPNEARMGQDAASAFAYLTATKHVMPAQIIPFGDGVGATLAARLTASNAAVPAVVLRNAPQDEEAMAARDARSRMLPAWLLFHERFEIQPTVDVLKRPKLLLEMSDARGDGGWMRSASSPKVTVTINGFEPAEKKEAQTQEAMRRFFDDNLNVPPTSLPLQ